MQLTPAQNSAASVCSSLGAPAGRPVDDSGSRAEKSLRREGEGGRGCSGALRPLRAGHRGVCLALLSGPLLRPFGLAPSHGEGALLAHEHPLEGVPGSVGQASQGPSDAKALLGETTTVSLDGPAPLPGGESARARGLVAVMEPLGEPRRSDLKSAASRRRCATRCASVSVPVLRVGSASRPLMAGIRPGSCPALGVLAVKLEYYILEWTFDLT